MCVMTVSLSEDSGGNLVMENVARLTQTVEGIELEDVFGEVRKVAGMRVSEIQFTRGVTRLSKEQGR